MPPSVNSSNSEVIWELVPRGICIVSEGNALLCIIIKCNQPEPNQQPFGVLRDNLCDRVSNGQDTEM